MKRLLRIFAFLGGVGAIGWLIRSRLVGMTLNREPKAPEPVPEPIVDSPPESDLSRISGVAPAQADRLREAGIATVDQLAAADAEDLASRTGLDADDLSSWVNSAAALRVTNS